MCDLKVIADLQTHFVSLVLAEVQVVRACGIVWPTSNLGQPGKRRPPAFAPVVNGRASKNCPVLLVIDIHVRKSGAIAGLDAEKPIRRKPIGDAACGLPSHISIEVLSAGWTSTTPLRFNSEVQRSDKLVVEEVLLCDSLRSKFPFQHTLACDPAD